MGTDLVAYRNVGKLPHLELSGPEKDKKQLKHEYRYDDHEA
jgi:hypothetical protein